MNDKQFRPMLAGKADLAALRFPLLGSFKLDGVRMMVINGVCLSRSMKPFPNKRLQLQFGREELEGYDGELIVGNPWDSNVCDATRAEVMTIDGPCTADFYVFDRCDMMGTYLNRQAYLFPATRCHILPQTYIEDIAALEAFEEMQLGVGYEGVILRSPEGLYKYGRSTTKEQWLLKLKRFEDSEAEIIGMEELRHNDNVAFKSELGLTKRQTLQENKVGMGTMGALWGRDIHTGIEFKVGTGFTAEQRKWFWVQLKLTGESYVTRFGDKIPLVAAHNLPYMKYKFFPVGVKDKPRHPVYIGLRDKRDM